MADVSNNPDSKPRTLADSTNSDFSVEKSTNGDSYISNSGDMREFTNDPNYSSTEVNIDDFKIQAVIGRGSFGKVYVVIKKDNQEVYAMKTLKKDMILRKNQMQNTKVERMILERLNHPFIVKLHYAFQTPERLYFVIDFLNGGELFYHLRKDQRFDQKRT